MAFKYVVFAALVAVSHAGVLTPVAPLAYAAPAAIAKVDTEYDPNPQYNFAYDVQDGLTGDSKSQSESRNGDVVQGQYSLNDADGTRRIVDYTADPINGFNAVVRKEPLAVAAAPVVTKTVAPLAYSAPIAHAPLAYSAPIAHAPIAYSAPIAHAPLAYSAGIAHAPLAYSAPIAKLATPVVHSAPLIQSAPLLRSASLSPAVVHTSFSSPYATYTI